MQVYKVSGNNNIIFILLLSIILLNVTCKSKTHFNLLDKIKISNAKLLVGDSTYFDNWTKFQGPKLLTDDGNVYFVDSSAKEFHKPMEEILFINNSKDSLIDFLNSFYISGQNFEPSPCVLLLKHTFLFYSKNNKLIDKIDICFDCTKMISLKENKIIDIAQNKITYNSFIDFLQSRNVYLYHAFKL